MIPINLLPHREVRRKAQQRQFGGLALIAAIAAIVAVIAVHGFLATRIENQQARNRFLDGEIAKLDKQIDEIKKLKEQTSLCSRASTWWNRCRAIAPRRSVCSISWCVSCPTGCT
jgi:Tfp pilus assembly protein PilN